MKLYTQSVHSKANPISAYADGVSFLEKAPNTLDKTLPNHGRLFPRSIRFASMA